LFSPAVSPEKRSLFSFVSPEGPFPVFSFFSTFSLFMQIEA